MAQYIHQLAAWPHFKLDLEALAPLLARVRHQQGFLLGKMAELGFDLQRDADAATVTSDVMQTSAIEGENLPLEEVRSSVARKLGLPTGGLPAPSRQVEGIVEVVLDATKNHELPVTAERLFRWHHLLFPTGLSNGLPITVGAWRPSEAGPMRVVSGAIGRERIHFETPSAERLDAEMGLFLEWFNAPSQVDPVLKAGIAHFWFVTIHPFEDGNGRLARAVADLQLARADRSLERFYSMSSQIASERKEYYLNLEMAQRGSLDITTWLVWFLECLGRAIAAAETNLAAVIHKSRLWQCINREPVNERQRTVINRLLADFHGFLTSTKYAKLAKCSQDTAARDIRELQDRGILMQNPGRGRSTTFRLAELEELPGQ